jgi:K+-sensing histidine kinase KdpD
MTTKEKGMGIGLAVSRSVVEAHGGRLWAENNKTGGATLNVVLPLSHSGVPYQSTASVASGGTTPHPFRR